MKLASFNWNAVSAIGSWLGALATFTAATIALFPYFKKGKLYFTVYSNTDSCPVLNIINNKPEGIFIERICFYAGHLVFRKCFFEDNFIEQQDDLVSDKTNNFLEPYSKKKINYSATRMVHDWLHSNYNIKGFSKKHFRIVVYTNIGKIKINTKIRTDYFIETLIPFAGAYNHYSIDQLMKFLGVNSK